jgi:hypothetical protein
MQCRLNNSPNRLARVLWFGLLVVLLLAPLERQAGAHASSFAPKVDFGTGTEPYSVAVGDFNGDGRLDIAVANLLSDTVSILLGTGTGTFGPKADFATGPSPASVTVGDFNKDGKLDLAVANRSGNSISILLGAGNGTFGAKTDFGDATLFPVWVAAGDFNGDGTVDLAIANAFNDSVSIMLGTGTGSFGTHTDFNLNGSGINSVAVGDFNRDGKLDLATANSAGMSIFLGTGTGSFGPKTNFGSGANHRTVAVGDFNADGKLDLATANTGSNSISILLGTGAGTFGAEVQFPAGTNPQAVAVGDFNADGKLDVASANNGDTISVLLGDGKGSFAPNIDFAADNAPAAIAVGDFNGDSRPDVVVGYSDPSSNAVSVLLNTSPTVSAGLLCNKADFATGSRPFSVAAGDFNGDGILDLTSANANGDSISIMLGTGAGAFGPKTDFGTGAGPFSVAVGDFNRDGKLDLATANANSDTVSILLGTGTGNFGTKTDFITAATPRSVAVGDFNLDGNLDLAVADFSRNAVSILLGTGTGTFGPKSDYDVGVNPAAVALGDFNNDGKLDFVTANLNSNNVSILLGTGLGTFYSRTDFFLGGAPYSVAVGDFNRDGNLDVAVAKFASNTVSILTGSGSGSFVSSTDFATGSGPFSVVVADFNLDGKLDLAVADVNGDMVSVLLGTGSGAFGARTDFGTGISPRSVVAGDFNRDGRLDLAVANEISSNISVLKNTCSNSPPGIATSPITITAGNGSANYQIAMVDDAVDPEPDLIVTVNGGTSATNNGVNLSGITVNAVGTVAANLAAVCGATTASFTVRVTNSGGLFAEATLTVMVNPNNGPPTITCPGDIVAHTDRDLCSAVVTFAPTVTGICSAAGGPVCSPASGSAFPKGVTTVTCHLSDLLGNQISCSFTVRVIDAQRPTCAGPGNIVRSTEPNQCSAVVTFNATASDNCPAPLNPSCSPSSGFRFPKGTTLVTCHFVDASANEQTCIFEVTVVDSQPPTFATPGNIAATAAASCPYATSKVVTYANPVATDNCAVQSVVCNPPSGSIFPVGATTVNCTATDTSNNIATCSFTVNVYSFGIQDEFNAGNVVLVNAGTGDYSFCCNGVPIAGGRGILNVGGCLGSIDQTKGDRRVHIEWDASANGNAGTGFATVKKSAGSTVCQITDKQLTNNSCQCSTAPPAIIIAPSPPPG